MLVGVDDHSDYPTEVVNALPKIGPDLGVDVDSVRELKPDLVLTSLTLPGHEKIVEALNAAGLPILVVDPQSLDDVYADIERIACALGVGERGRDLTLRMRREAVACPSETMSRPSMLVEWWPKPVIVPGKRSWVSDMLLIAGAVNPWSDRDCKSLPVTDEEVIAAAPKAIILSWCGVAPEKVRPDVVRRRGAWGSVPAVANDRIYCVPEAWMGRPGPRLILGIREMGRIVADIPEF
jgi:iron complex transport system substrate-binding protein